MTTKKPWFPVKRLGYGVGLPIAWEGWLALFLYLAVVILSAILLHPLATAIVVIVATAALVYICRVKSDAEWRWRSGD